MEVNTPQVNSRPWCTNVARSPGSGWTCVKALPCYPLYALALFFFWLRWMSWDAGP